MIKESVATGLEKKLVFTTSMNSSGAVASITGKIYYSVVVHFCVRKSD
jgi:hypothetical protein